MVWMMVSKRGFWVTIILVNLDRSGDDKSCDFIIVSAPAVLINLNKNSLKWCEAISASHFLYLIFSQILKLTLHTPADRDMMEKNGETRKQARNNVRPHNMKNYVFCRRIANI